MPGSLLQNVDWTQNSEIMLPPQVCLPLRPARHIPRVLEIAEGLPVSAVQGPVGDAQQLRRALHVNLLVLDSLKHSQKCIEVDELLSVDSMQSNILRHYETDKNTTIFRVRKNLVETFYFVFMKYLQSALKQDLQ